MSLVLDDWDVSRVIAEDDSYIVESSIGRGNWRLRNTISQTKKDLNLNGLGLSLDMIHIADSTK